MSQTEPGPETQSETDATLTDLARGKAERVALGTNPFGSMLRMVLFAFAFIVVFGTIFYLAQ